MVEPQITRRLQDRVTCRATGFQSAVIEHRFDFDETAQFLRLGRFAAGQGTPGETYGAAGKRSLYRVGRHGYRARQVIELDLPVLHAHKAEV